MLAATMTSAGALVRSQALLPPPGQHPGTWNMGMPGPGYGELPP
jgi:hypothetical protein